MVGDSQSIDNFLVPPRKRVRNQPSRLGWLVPFSPSASPPPCAGNSPRTLETTWRNGPLPCAIVTIGSTKLMFVGLCGKDFNWGSEGKEHE